MLQGKLSERDGDGVGMESTGEVLAALLGGEEEGLDDLDELLDLLRAQHTVADHVQRLVDALNAHDHHLRVGLLLHRVHEGLKEVLEQANRLFIVLCTCRKIVQYMRRKQRIRTMR